MRRDEANAVSGPVLRAASDPSAALEHEHALTRVDERVRSHCATEPAADDDHVPLCFSSCPSQWHASPPALGSARQAINGRDFCLAPLNAETAVKSAQACAGGVLDAIRDGP